MTIAIEANGLSRSYADLRAVDGLSLTVNAGELFALLGPNGGGKTTTLGMLTTMLRPSAGTAHVAGHDVSTQPHEVRSRIGVVFQGPSLDEQLTARENLDFHARIYNMPRALFQQRADELLALVELAERQHEAVRTFSGGMRRRLELARALLHQPQVLFLDEPTVGLDPQTRRAIWDYLHTLRQQSGVTIFLTTHYLEEAEGCDRVAILDGGTLAALDTPAALKATLGGDVLYIRTADVQAAEHLLQAEGLAVRRGSEGLAVEANDGPRRIPELVAILEGQGQRVEAVNLRRPSLEDVFIKLTGRAIRAEAPEASAAPARRGRMGRKQQ
ncbi:MAG TPA: ATP-binding cassette domain-containing protein [Anaerolineales bacterium]|nr:ATP-binding cassette domain-containing protein [Anaerolineales bacterium]HRQ91458.1 ATP-binding cassette domain-containing protein [Anaerolineales bacterium]